MNQKLKEYNLVVFKESCEESGYKISDERWEGNELLCTLYSSLYGVCKDVRVYLYRDMFKLKYKGDMVTKFFRSYKDEWSSLENEFYCGFEPKVNEYRSRSGDRTKRRTKHK